MVGSPKGEFVGVGVDKSGGLADDACDAALPGVDRKLLTDDDTLYGEVVLVRERRGPSDLKALVGTLSGRLLDFGDGVDEGVDAERAGEVFAHAEELSAKRWFCQLFSASSTRIRADDVLPSRSS